MAIPALADLMNWKGWGIVGVVVSIFATIAALLGWEVKKMPEIEFGNPVDRAGERQLSWWQVPLSIKKTKWYQQDRLMRCRISVKIITDDLYPCGWTTINGPTDVMDLIESDEPQYVPIIARSTYDQYAISGDPRSRPYIQLEKGTATLTDLSALINGTGIKTLPPGKYELQLRVRVPGKTPKTIPSQTYRLEIPPQVESNHNFIMR